MKIKVLTIFPEFVKSFFNTSLIKKAVEGGIIDVRVLDIRDFAFDKHKVVDDRPYGGGEGMVLKPEPISKALESVLEDNSYVIYLTPRGEVFNGDIAKELSQKEDLIFLCGRYEGVDERVIEKYVDREISIGDFILNGGEVAAMAVIESTVRFLPGVVGKEESVKNESFENFLLEPPVYTRPASFMGMDVPEVLRSGNHREIKKWKLKRSILETKKRRPDLYKKYLKFLKGEGEK